MYGSRGLVNFIVLNCFEIRKQKYDDTLKTIQTHARFNTNAGLNRHLDSSHGFWHH